MRALRLALTALAGVFWGATAVAMAVHEASVGTGLFRLSLHDPSRVAFQAALLSAMAVACWRPRTRRRLVTALAVATVLLTGAIDSSSRRVGDGAEYMAMTLRLADGRAPSLDDAALQHTTSQLSRMGWLNGGTLTGVVQAADGGWEFQHFWLYSSAIAPVAAVLARFGAPPGVAFTLVNATLLLSLVWLLGGRGDTLLALLVGIGPLVWWVDKAHTEVFIAAALGVASLLAREHRRWAVVAAGVAAAQNPAALGPLLVLVWGLAWRRDAPCTDYLALAGAVAIAALHPAYSLLRLGRLSPLLPPDGPHWPALRALVTPVVDPNVGLLLFAPAVAVLVVAGLARQSPPARARTACSIGLLLLAASQAGNVNHGGTPGMSRYALWLIAAGLPAAAVAARRLQEHRGAAVLVVGLTAATTWGAFRPALADDRHLRPTALADAMWARWPALDNPLPEVFAERTGGRDGTAAVPASNDTCRKVLTIGTGTEALFPFPCEPAPAPAACVAAGALCYANAGAFTLAPKQPGFVGRPIPERAWTPSTRASLEPLATVLGPERRAVRFGQSPNVIAGDGLDYLWIVEGRRALAVWVYPLAGHDPVLTLAFDHATTAVVRDAVTLAERERVALGPGTQRVALHVTTPVVVVALTSPEAVASCRDHAGSVSSWPCG